MKNKLEIECLCSWPGYVGTTTNLQAPVFQRLDSAIHRINLYLVDKY